MPPASSTRARSSRCSIRLAPFAAMRRQFALRVDAEERQRPRRAGRCRTAQEPARGGDGRARKLSYDDRASRRRSSTPSNEERRAEESYFVRTRTHRARRHPQHPRDRGARPVPHATRHRSGAVADDHRRERHGEEHDPPGVALTLWASASERGSGLDPADLVRHRARAALVEVYLSGVPTPLRLRITRTGFRAETSSSRRCCCSGTARRAFFPRPAAATPAPEAVARVDNLFNPFAPHRGRDVLAPLARPSAGSTRCRASLKTLADARRRARASSATGVAAGWRSRADGDRIPLAQLSDGYQSIARAGHRRDEGDAQPLGDDGGRGGHRARSTSSARICTRAGGCRSCRARERRSPACSSSPPRTTRSACAGSATARSPSSADGPTASVYRVDDLPSIAGLRVDQLLTSEFFGLNSTFDPELDRLFTRYYELKAKRTLDAAEQRRSRARARLDEHRVLGTTRRERLMLEAADDFLAPERRTDRRPSAKELQDETKAKIVELWAGHRRARRRRRDPGAPVRRSREFSRGTTVGEESDASQYFLRGYERGQRSPSMHTRTRRRRGARTPLPLKCAYCEGFFGSDGARRRRALRPKGGYAAEPAGS